MLHLLSDEFFKTGAGIGKVLEFGGPGTMAMSLDERATLTNMAVEAGGFTGIIEADELVVEYIANQRGTDRQRLRQQIVVADAGATYGKTFDIDLATVQPTVATPGDPRNGIALQQLRQQQGKVAVHIAYGGSCTGGKKADMDMYAGVVRKALERGRSLQAKTYIQFGSQRIRDYAEQMGYIQLFEGAGVELIDPSCGACIKAGPGVSFQPEEVTVSAINRNFPGRSGPGQVYLASPYVVVASAFLGYVGGPDEL
jgi:3-isopropylmalate/(R)-2-methylmalate dehydratase large subunit